MARGNISGIATPLRAPVVVTDDFLPAKLALAMRQNIDAHFANPNAHRAETHQIWDYWFVPGLYTYLRTSPEKIIIREHVNVFQQTLIHWSLTTLGMGSLTRPYLSLYVSGCRQGWHNDSTNGRFGFVYSLTKDDRRTVGGETLILREGDLFRGNLTRPNAGRGLHEIVEPKFNRLVIFDDRLSHAVERVEGPMDPAEGRFVLHGHLRESNIAVAGALPPDLVLGPLAETLDAFVNDTSAQLALYHGPLALRITISRNGAVANCTVLLDRVIHRDPGHTEWEPLLAAMVDLINRAKFPEAEGETIVIRPIIFGGPLQQS